MSLIVIKTVNKQMLQDTTAGRIYTPKRPYLTEMNSFVESFSNPQVSGVQGQGNRKRPTAITVLVNSDKTESLNDGVKDSDLADAWLKYTTDLRKEGGNKAVDSLTDADWKKWATDWVKENSGAKKAAPKKEEGEGNGEGGNTGQQNQTGNQKKA